MKKFLIIIGILIIGGVLGFSEIAQGFATNGMTCGDVFGVPEGTCNNGGISVGGVGLNIAWGLVWEGGDLGGDLDYCEINPYGVKGETFCSSCGFLGLDRCCPYEGDVCDTTAAGCINAVGLYRFICPQCYGSKKIYAKLEMCPSTNDYENPPSGESWANPNGQSCRVAIDDAWDFFNNPQKWGYWDADDPETADGQCVVCKDGSGNECDRGDPGCVIEGWTLGDTAGIKKTIITSWLEDDEVFTCDYDNNGICGDGPSDVDNGDGLCESACGASAACDELNPGDSCGGVSTCDDDCQCGGGFETHMACSGEHCIVAAGPGADECTVATEAVDCAAAVPNCVADGDCCTAIPGCCDPGCTDCTCDIDPDCSCSCNGGTCCDLDQNDDGIEDHTCSQAVPHDGTQCTLPDEICCKGCNPKVAAGNYFSWSEKIGLHYPTLYAQTDGLSTCTDPSKCDLCTDIDGAFCTSPTGPGCLERDKNCSNCEFCAKIGIATICECDLGPICGASWNVRCNNAYASCSVFLDTCISGPTAGTLEEACCFKCDDDCCGDGECEGDEDSNNCPEDCGGIIVPPPPPPPLFCDWIFECMDHDGIDLDGDGDFNDDLRQYCGPPGCDSTNPASTCDPVADPDQFFDNDPACGGGSGLLPLCEWHKGNCNDGCEPYKRKWICGPPAGEPDCSGGCGESGYFECLLDNTCLLSAEGCECDPDICCANEYCVEERCIAPPAGTDPDPDCCSTFDAPPCAPFFCDLKLNLFSEGDPEETDEIELDISAGENSAFIIMPVGSEVCGTNLGIKYTGPPLADVGSPLADNPLSLSFGGKYVLFAPSGPAHTTSGLTLASPYDSSAFTGELINFGCPLEMLLESCDCPGCFVVPSEKWGIENCKVRISLGISSGKVTLSLKDTDGHFIEYKEPPLPLFPGGLVLCGRHFDDPTTNIDESMPCTLCHAFMTTKRIIDFALFKILLPLIFASAVIGGGFLILAGGSSKKIAAGKTILLITGRGVIIAFGGWLIIETLVVAFTPNAVPWRAWDTIVCPVAPCDEVDSAIDDDICNTVVGALTAEDKIPIGEGEDAQTCPQDCAYNLLKGKNTEEIDWVADVWPTSPNLRGCDFDGVCEDAEKIDNPPDGGNPESCPDCSVCGDGVVDIGEECDGNAFRQILADKIAEFGGIQSCEAFVGYSGGTFNCTSSCKINMEECEQK